MAISKTALKRKITARPAQNNPGPTPTSDADKPWTRLFLDYGYSKAGIPIQDPPTELSYGAVLTWVTKDQWELPDDSNLAIDIWMGRVCPFTYQSPPPEEVSVAVKTEAAKEASRGAASAPPIKPKNRFMKKSRDAEVSNNGPNF